MTNHAGAAGRETEFTLAQLRGDCARMAPHWVVPMADVPAPVLPSSIHGVVVPSASARLVEAMPEYGQ
ncbi:hypothetical protein [Streptomyces sp. NBC_00690]|uniref:hypothetical protein n=1 Tax=Streptomyces sp. NBC_00690 TaxID=2975808 RepID=UPI002E29BD3C|nr:hypothetical protein [Streptomyces sp. NBC_00690]